MFWMMFTALHALLHNHICDCYHIGKQHKLPFTRSSIKSTTIFELIHIDIWSPISILSVHGH